MVFGSAKHEPPNIMSTNRLKAEAQDAPNVAKKAPEKDDEKDDEDKAPDWRDYYGGAPVDHEENHKAFMSALKDRVDTETQELRKWAVDQAIDTGPSDPMDILHKAKKFEAYITGKASA